MTYAQNEALRRQRTIDAQNQQIIMEEQRRRDERSAGGDSGAGLLGGLIGIALVIALLIWLVRILAVSLLAIAPIAGLLWLYTRLMRGSAELGFLTALKTTFIGIFAYLALTATIAIAVGAIHVAAKTGAAAALVNALFELRKESLESLAVLKDGRGDSAALLGLLGAGMQPASTRWMAVAALHAPGLLMFAFSLNRYIGRPYDGVVGMLIACGITLATVPLCVGGLVWFLGVH